MMFPNISWSKVLIGLTLYVLVYSYTHQAEASTEKRTMFCNMFQARFDSFGAALREGISIERLERVINETSIVPEEAKMYKSMVGILLADDMYKDTVRVNKFGHATKMTCLKGEDGE